MFVYARNHNRPSQTLENDGSLWCSEWRGITLEEDAEVVEQLCECKTWELYTGGQYCLVRCSLAETYCEPFGVHRAWGSQEKSPAAVSIFLLSCGNDERLLRGSVRVPVRHDYLYPRYPENNDS